VLVATYITFGLAVLCGVYLIAVAGWQILLIGVASIIAGVLYTGGPRPYGYEGLGEVFVFLFFGFAAVAGSYFAQVRDFSWESLVLSVPIGLIAAAVLVVNNTRDIDTDRRANKRTLAVRLGRERSRRMYATMLLITYPIVLIPWVFGPLTAWLILPLLSLPLALGLIRIVSEHTVGPSLNRALAKTGQLQLVFCVLLSAGLLLSR
jgi:1,4-dihydroxy-2-naphthoate octaprenyltransferase